MKKRYSVKWQWYFIRILWNDPLVVPKEESVEELRKKEEYRAVIASMVGASTETSIYYRI